MKGDFTRITSHAGATRVLMQQGRVQLDADWNELVATLVESQRRLAADLIGPHGGPKGDVGFAITNAKLGPDFGCEIGAGTYYVDGLRCATGGSSYVEQADLPGKPSDLAPWQATERELFGKSSLGSDVAQGKSVLVYLDAWERHVCAAEDPSLADVALNGLDTATRAVLTSQVRMFALPVKLAAGQLGVTQVADVAELGRACLEELEKAFPRTTNAKLAAQARKLDDDSDPCLSAPDARYRGPENQLYRVEVHRGGPVSTATFKWSRDNGAVVFQVAAFGKGETAPVPAGRVDVVLEHLGRDDRSTLREGDWVELVDATHARRGAPGPLARCVEVDRDMKRVTLDFQDEEPMAPVASTFDDAILRRWDHRGDPHDLKSGALLIREGANEADWMTLEDGVEVRFRSPGGNQRSRYRSGDFWLIPARTATGDVAEEVKSARPPDGISHHYAPLALVTVAAAALTVKDLRLQFVPPLEVAK